MRTVLGTAFLCLSLGISFCQAKDDGKKWNVLFIMSDDLNVSLGSYGHPLAQTPNIDRLAREGVRFEHAYCQFPHCNPSRSSLLTGRRPDVIKVMGNSDNFRDAVPDTVTLPQLFRENGYFTARVGKIYHRSGEDIRNGTSGLDDSKSWEVVLNPVGRPVSPEEQARIGGATPGRLSSTLISWLVADGTDTEQSDGMVAEEAIKLLLQQKADRPFFLAVGIFRPHTPYVAPRKYFDLYPPDKISAPYVPPDHMEKGPRAAFASREEYPDYKRAEMTDPYIRQAIQAYLASTSFMDAQVGRVLDALKKSGLQDSTIVVFLSDHGYHLGDHGLWHKRSLFEHCARVPLIIDAPAAKGNGHPAAAPVESLDIYPTLAALCGLKPPPYLDGVSLVPMLNDPNASVKAGAVTEVTHSGKFGYTIRTPRYRYTEWGRGKLGTQLYDMENDPQEFNNLAEDPKHAGIVEAQRKLLHQVIGEEAGQSLRRLKGALEKGDGAGN